MSAGLKKAAAWGLLHSGALGLARRLRERRRAALLMYHRVNDERDPFFPALPVATFVQQLEYLARRYRVESLSDVSAWLAGGAPGPARIAITIDDGYPDTHDCVLPALRRIGVPATLFLATAPPETGRPLWLDRVRHVVKQTRQKLFEHPSLGSGPLPLDSREAKLKALRSLLRRMKRLGPVQVETLLAQLESRLGEGEPEPRPISWDQVRALASGPVDIGGHTHHHYLLSVLDDETLGQEVTTSVELIEQRVGARPATFAYPNGESADFDERAFSLLRGLGVRCAVTTQSGFARPGQNAFALPRVYTTERYFPLFAARLSGLGQEIA